MNTLWQNKLRAEPELDMLEYTSSLSFDIELAEADIAVSQAHVIGLKKARLITKEEQQILLGALKDVGQEFKEKSFQTLPTDEDIHTAIERRVTEKVGQVGAKLHTGRSRNDQVATTFRLWIKAKLVSITHQIQDFQKVLLARAVEAKNATMPGYTHLQRAQPIYLADHLLAHGWALSRDISRIQDTIARMDTSPLGAGALAGSSLGLDPDHTAELLGFSSSFESSLDAVSDRDFVADTLMTLTMLSIHLSRIGEEIIIWSSDEVGFLELPEAWSTGSSMLPQKKNPDIAELIRAKSGRLIGNLTGFLATLKGLPLSYNRDLQEDKEPVFDSVKNIQQGMVSLSGLLAASKFNLVAMEEAAQAPELFATALAEYLVKKHNTPFRKAHEQVGALVYKWQAGGLDPKELVEQELGDQAAQLIGSKPNGNITENIRKFRAHIRQTKTD